MLTYFSLFILRKWIYELLYLFLIFLCFDSVSSAYILRISDIIFTQIHYFKLKEYIRDKRIYIHRYDAQ